MEDIRIRIDGQAIKAAPGMTILQAAQSAGIQIPTICYHEATTANAVCRLCVVEVKGARVLVPACVAQVSDGMEVYTRSERVERSRRTILEMLDSALDLSDASEIQEFMHDYHADSRRFPGARTRRPPVIDDNPMYIRDYARCVLCWRCVQVCADDAQYTFAINFSGRGFDTQIGTFFDHSMPETTCVFCGQCVAVCPTGALKSKREWLLEQGRTPEDILQATRRDRKRRRSTD
jgi:NADH dehydrogenase/NADH:ubiquinone oxidoreductase subunit G